MVGEITKVPPIRYRTPIRDGHQAGPDTMEKEDEAGSASFPFLSAVNVINNKKKGTVI